MAKEVLNLVNPVQSKPVDSVDLSAAVRSLLPGALYDAFVENVRKSILTEELGALTDRISAINENVTSIRDDLTNASPTSKSPIEPAHQSDWPPRAVELDDDEVIVSELSLSFLELHALIASSVISRRPILMGIRSGYSANYEPQLQINDRDGKYGIDHHMRTVTMTLTIYDDYVDVEGSYWDTSVGYGGREVPLTKEQIKRIVEELVECGRAASNFDPNNLPDRD